jgi:uncharacterized low-complexity protein
MKLHKKTAIALSVCTALAATASAAVKYDSIEVSPFQMQKLAGGYMVAASQEGKESDGVCGAAEDKDDTEGACGEGSCGAAEDKDDTEGACGEGSCGGQF